MSDLTFLPDPPAFRAPPAAFVARVPSEIASKAALLEALAGALTLPAHFGRNWDALEECLGDLSWIGAHDVVLVHTALPRLSDEELRAYRDALEAAVRSWEPGERHALQVIFPDSARPQLAAL